MRESVEQISELEVDERRRRAAGREQHRQEQQQETESPHKTAEERRRQGSRPRFQPALSAPGQSRQQAVADQRRPQRGVGRAAYPYLVGIKDQHLADARQAIRKSREGEEAP